MNFLAFDLELEQPNRHDITDSYVRKSTIIQVGWVVFSPENQFEILQENEFCINIGVPLSSFIKKLTKIRDEDIRNGKSIEEVCDLLIDSFENFNCLKPLIQWGSGDQRHLMNELPQSVKFPFGNDGQNIKHLYRTYAIANKLKYSCGLSKAVNQLGLNWIGRQKHDALVDAKNTAQIFWYLFQQLKK